MASHWKAIRAGLSILTMRRHNGRVTHRCLQRPRAPARRPRDVVEESVMNPRHRTHRRPAWEADLLFLRWLVAAVAAGGVLAFGWGEPPQAQHPAPVKAGAKR
jgi:hypothetical protein